MWAAHKVKIISILLTVSVLANIGMGGMMAGKHAAKWAWHPRQSLENIMRAVKGLPEAQKAEVHEVLKDYGGRMREGGDAIRKQRDYVRTLASQQTLDKEKLAEALRELRTLMGSTQEIGHEMILSVIDKIPLSERARLFERSRAGAEWDKEKKGKRHEP